MQNNNNTEIMKWLFGDAAQPVVKSEQSRPAGSIADTQKLISQTRKQLNALLGIESTTVDKDGECGSPQEDAGCYLSPNRALSQRITKDDAGVTPSEVDRVNKVLSLADRLLLKRDNVMALIEKLGFDAVESTIAILAGESINKSLRDVLGIPVTHVTIEDVEQITKSHIVTKEAGTAQDLQTWLGLKLK